jgi:D-aspartate ligase
MTQVGASRFDATTPALAVSLSEYPLHQSSLGIIRSLGRLGVPTYIVQRRRFMPAGTSKYLSGQFLWDTPGDDSGVLLDGLTAIANRIGRPTVLIPTDDLTAIFVAEHSEAMPPAFLFARPPPSVPRMVANKLTLYQLCRRLGIACPEIVVPSSREEVCAIVERANFPVVAKAAEPWLLPRSFKSTTIVWQARELLDLYERLSDAAPAVRLLIQEMIPLADGEDWIVHGYCSAQSEIRVFTGLKLRSYPPHAGATSFGRCVRNDALGQQAVDLLQAIGYRGILDLDYRLDKRDGQYKLLDFNPRIGAQFRLFEDDSDIDVARALYLDLTGQEVPCGRQVDDRTFVVDLKDAVARLSYRKHEGHEIRARLASLGHARERAWFARDDVRPFFVMCWSVFSRGMLPRIRVNLRTSPIGSRATPSFRARSALRQRGRARSD